MVSLWGHTQNNTLKGKRFVHCTSSPRWCRFQKTFPCPWVWLWVLWLYTRWPAKYNFMTVMMSSHIITRVKRYSFFILVVLNYSFKLIFVLCNVLFWWTGPYWSYFPFQSFPTSPLPHLFSFLPPPSLLILALMYTKYTLKMDQFKLT